MKADVSIKDVIFILVFSTLVFFGAFFLFSSLKKPSQNRQVSVRSLERSVNKRINKKIQKLQTRGLIFKSKIAHSARIDRNELLSEDVGNNNEDYELDVFESQVSDAKEIVPKNAAEKIMAFLESEDQSEADKKMMIREYKEQIIRKARAQGWAIEINDKLEVISAKQL